MKILKRLLDFLKGLFGRKSAPAFAPVKAKTVRIFSTYRYQDDHDTEYLRRLLR